MEGMSVSCMVVVEESGCGRAIRARHIRSSLST